MKAEGMSREFYSTTQNKYLSTIASMPREFYSASMDFKAEILRAKGKRNLSQFAKDIGITRQSLYNAMNGDTEPSYKLLKALGLIRQKVKLAATRAE